MSNEGRFRFLSCAFCASLWLNEMIYLIFIPAPARILSWRLPLKNVGK